MNDAPPTTPAAAPPSLSEPDLKFQFGRNWQAFHKVLSDQRRAIARKSITDFLGLTSLEGKTFIDAGCGSGLFSEAAFQLGAQRVVSFDVDPFSVKCAEHLHERAGRPAHWQVMRGSVLDPAFLATLGRADIVYSWGVLHHTGHLWAALDNVTQLVRPPSATGAGDGGLLYISIYNKVKGPRGSKNWVWRKKLYCQSPAFIKRAIELGHWLYFLQAQTLRGRNPWKKLRDYEQKRGMAWRTDLIDWLGGYPYEYASVQELFDAVKQEFVMTNLAESRNLGTHSLLLQRVR